MNSDLHTPENPQQRKQQETHLPIASLSLSLSTILHSKNLSFNPNIASFFQINPTILKIPSQINFLSHLRISSIPFSPNNSFTSKVSSLTLQIPIASTPNLPSEPRNAAGCRRTSIMWFRNDLRVNDNECLNTANNESVSLLPVFCFDPREYETKSFRINKAEFLIESVSDLRRSLQARGSDLVIRIGKVEDVLVELVEEVGADAVYAHCEVKHEDFEMEERVESVLKDEGVEVKYFWGSTLIHAEDLPFEMKEMPSTFDVFKKKIGGVEIRKTLDSIDRLKGKPARGNVESGDVPTLMDLGFKPAASITQDGNSATSATIVGGETRALEMLQKLAAEFQTQPSQGTKDSIYGANFSCKISPWLAMGCVSPRSVFDEMKKAAARAILPAASSKINSDTSMSWLTHELTWRDFFRFVTRKYSSATKQNAAPATLFTGALA